MSGKLSHEAVLPISYSLFMQHRKVIRGGEIDTSTSKGLEEYGKHCAEEFATFHKAFHGRLAELLGEDK